jgi:hypothetical protein
MDPFLVGLIVLFSSAAVFYIVIFSFIFYWHLKKQSFIVLPVVFTFEFFVTGFLIISLVSIIIKYSPDLIRVSGI